MNVNDILTDGFGRIRGEVQSATAGLSGAGLNYQPDPDANSIGWLVWHLTRVQDDHIAHLADRPQEYVERGWAQRLGLTPDEKDLGYGHTAEQVRAVKVDAPDDLLAYHGAVHRHTLDYIGSVTADELDRVIDTRWDPPVTAGVRIVSVIDDCMNHAGQANYVRGMFERLSGTQN